MNRIAAVRAAGLVSGIVFIPRNPAVQSFPNACARFFRGVQSLLQCLAQTIHQRATWQTCASLFQSQSAVCPNSVLGALRGPSSHSSASDTAIHGLARVSAAPFASHSCRHPNNLFFQNHAGRMFELCRPFTKPNRIPPGMIYKRHPVSLHLFRHSISTSCLSLSAADLPRLVSTSNR